MSVVVNGRVQSIVIAANIEHNDRPATRDFDRIGMRVNLPDIRQVLPSGLFSVLEPRCQGRRRIGGTSSPKP